MNVALRVVIGALVVIFEVGIIYVVFLGGESPLIFFLLLIAIAAIAGFAFWDSRSFRR